MRVLITSLPGHGHLGPLIPLATAIRDAGHDVAIATSSTFSEMLQSHGLRCEPCGPAWRESDFGRNLQQPLLLEDLGKFIDAEVNPRVLADVAEIVTRSRPDMVVSNDYEPNGRVVAEQAGIPFVLVSSGPRMSREMRQKAQGYILRRARMAGGLPESDELGYSLRWLHLCFSPQWYVYGRPGEFDPPEAPNQYGIRPRVADYGRRFEPRPDARVTGDTRPAALCTFGTVFNKDPDILRKVIGAIAPRVRKLFVLTGPGLEPESLGTQSFATLPPAVELLADTALTSLLPHVDYVITHGGTSTLTAIQLHGKPCLLLPLGADQIINGTACERRMLSVVRFHTPAGSGTTRRTITPMTQESVAAAFDELVSDPGYRDRATRFQNALEALPPKDHAVDLLERLSSTRAPVLRHP
jgi:UDP:flavonoid glycosyltransferase YjiC (YdhE family)